jgi:hypothetical protein
MRSRGALDPRVTSSKFSGHGHLAGVMFGFYDEGAGCVRHTSIDPLNV